MKLFLLTLFALVATQKFNIKIEDAEGSVTHLEESLILDQQVDVASRQKLPELLNAIKGQKKPCFLAITFEDTSSEKRFVTPLVLNYQIVSFVVEAQLDPDFNVVGIAVLPGENKRLPTSIRFQETINLDKEEIERELAGLPKREMNDNFPIRDPRLRGAKKEVPPPVEPPKEESFFKKYFWYIAIGGFFLMQILTLDGNKMKEAYRQAEESANQRRA